VAAAMPVTHVISLRDSPIPHEAVNGPVRERSGDVANAGAGVVCWADASGA
jgi:hypothetical protein